MIDGLTGILFRSLQGYRTGYPYRIPDVFTPVAHEKVPESQVMPIIPSYSLKKSGYGGGYQESSPIKSSHGFGRSSLHKNKLKWLNAPVLGTQYKKETPVST